MKKLLIGIGDKILTKWLGEKEYVSVSDEGEAIGVAGGYWLATGERAEVFMSADGFMNALNFITSWVIPENIEMDITISTGRQEPSHKVATDMLPDIIKLLPYDSKRIVVKIIERE